jgi:hypothetical protein
MADNRVNAVLRVEVPDLDERVLRDRGDDVSVLEDHTVKHGPLEKAVGEVTETKSCRHRHRNRYTHTHTHTHTHSLT